MPLSLVFTVNLRLILPSQLVPTILSVSFHSWSAFAELSASSLGRAIEQFWEVRQEQIRNNLYFGIFFVMRNIFIIVSGLIPHSIDRSDPLSTPPPRSIQLSELKLRSFSNLNIPPPLPSPELRSELSSARASRKYSGQPQQSGRSTVWCI